MEIAIDSEQTIICNYSRCELDFFFIDELGGYNPKLKKYTPEHQVVTKLRQLLSHFFPFFSAVQIHSSGVIRNGKAALFLGPSSSGKTTVVNLSKGDPVLSDDQVVLRKEDKEIIAHSSPMGTITSGPCQARLGGLFLIEKADHFELSPLNPKIILPQLWTAQSNYSNMTPKDLRAEAFKTLYDACIQAGIYRMRFSKDYVDWDAIDRAME
jgi:hypothetical protein